MNVGVDHVRGGNGFSAAVGMRPSDPRTWPWMEETGIESAHAPVDTPDVAVPGDGRVRVVIGHRSPFLRDGLLLALGSAVGVHVVGVAQESTELAELVDRQRPDVTLAAPELRRTAPLPGLVVIVETLSDRRIGEIYASGARCVIPSEVGREELVALLHRVAAGERVVLDDTQNQLERATDALNERYGPGTWPAGEGPSAPRPLVDVREGPVVAALARAVVTAAALAATLGGFAGLPHPSASWTLVVLLALWAAISATFVRRPPPLPAWAGMVVDMLLSTGLGLAFADLLAFGVPLGILLVTFALRASPRTVAVAAVAAGLEHVVFAVALSAPGAVARVVSFALVGLVAVMVSVVRDRREQEMGQLIVARRELLAEALSAEVRARRLIAEELHDDPLQLLLAAGQELDERDVDPEAVDRAAELVAEASLRFRAVMQRSATERFTPGRLREALEELCEHQSHRGGYAWSLAVGPGVDTVLHELLHGLVTELVVNVTKHANADHLTVRLSARGRGAELVVKDDGVGVPTGRLEAAAEEGHLGMRAIRRRVDAAEGTLEIVASPGEGTEVRVWLPSPVRR